MKNYTFHVSGTHCNACKMLIEDVLSDDATLTNSSVDLQDKTLSLESSEDKQEIVLTKLNENLIPLGFTISTIL